MAKKQASPAQAEVSGTAAVVEQTPKADAPEKGISETLFPDMQPKAPAEEPKLEETPSPTEPTVEEFDLEDFLAKQGIPLEKVKTKIKVDGVEETLSLPEYKKRVQLSEHINRAGQELGRQRRELMEMRKGTESERQPISQVPDNSDLDLNRAPSNSDPYVAQLERRLKNLESQTAGLNPVIYDVNRQEVAKSLKAEGYDDFLDYLPKMEAHLASVKDPAKLDYYDQREGAIELYKSLKLRDLMEGAKAPKSEAPKKEVLERPRPPITKIDGGEQPSSLNTTDDWKTKYDQLLDKWKTTKSRQDFKAVLEHQGSLKLS